MTEHDAFKKLQRALLFEPSPEFEASVRERIRQLPPPARGWLVWKPGMLAAAAVLALVGLSLWRAQSETTVPPPLVAQIIGEPVAPAGKPGFISAAPLKARMKPGFRKPAMPTVLVSPDQAIALDSFLLSLRSVSSIRATAVGEPVETAPEPEETSKAGTPPKPGVAPILGPPIPAIVIVPIKVELLTPVAPGGGSSKSAFNR